MREDEPEWLQKARRAFLDDKRDEAEQLTRDVLAEAEADGNTPAVIKALEYLTFLLMVQFERQSEYEEMGKRAARLKESHAKDTIRAIELEKGSAHTALIDPLLELASVYEVRLYDGRHQRPEDSRDLDDFFGMALALHDRAEDICKRAHGLDSEKHARLLMRRADLFARIAGAPKEALELIRQALAVFEGVDPKSKDSRMAKFSLAGTLRDACELEEAASIYEEIIAADPDDKASGPVRSLLAMTYERLGITDESLALQREVEEELDEVLAAKPYLSVPSVFHLAGDLVRAGKLREAEAEYRKALELNAASPNAQLMMQGLIQSELAECLSDLGRHDEAVAMSKEGLQSIEAALGSQHAHTASALMTICHCLAESGDDTPVSELLVRAADIIAQLPEGTLGRDRGQARACIALLESYSLDESAARIKSRLEALPEEWAPPS